MNHKTSLMHLVVGDIIKITSFIIGQLSASGPGEYTEMIGVEAIVVEKTSDYVHFRELTGKHIRPSFCKKIQCGGFKYDLIQESKGIPVEGVDYQITAREILQRDYRKFLDSIVWEHNGFKNEATYLAHLYLNNESRFHAQLNILRRKDGTINPKKVEKCFHELKLEIDAHAFDCPGGFPERFLPVIGSFIVENQWARGQNRVDWKQVAEEFRS